MKISVLGAGNVGSLTAMRLLQENLGDIVLVDIVKGLAKAKSLDLEDSRSILKNNYSITGSDDIGAIADSGVVVITAGLTRKPGMTREELLNKNASIIKGLCLNIKKLASQAIVILVTNPLDLMTYLAIKATGFKTSRVLGMGITLDASRLANIIALELNVAPSDVEPCVIASHGEGMLPLPRFTKVKGKSLNEFTDSKKTDELIVRTIGRGAEIVSLMGNGSAFFAPSAAVTQIVKCIINDEKRILGVCAYLKGEYGVKDTCIGVPCEIGKQGINKIIELELNPEESAAFLKSAANLKSQYSNLSV